jgi:predicted dehydrogenase
MLRAGLVGLGVMGRHHMRLLSQLDGVEFVGVHDPALAGHDFVNGHKVFGDLSDLIEARIDYCVIAAPTAFHLPPLESTVSLRSLLRHRTKKQRNLLTPLIEQVWLEE